MLKNRNNFPPGGFRFRQPETGWEPPRHLSFDDTVKQIIKHRLQNPQHKLATDRVTVETELENYTTARLQKIQGGSEWLLEGAATPLPKSLPSPNPAGVVAGAKKFAANAVAGASLWAKWFPDGRIVHTQVAERRAAVCLECPAHVRGNLAQRFNQIIARELHAVFGALKDQQMTTTRDSELAVCDICDCPMRAKVWVPLDLIDQELKPETRAKLPASCWIIKQI